MLLSHRLIRAATVPAILIVAASRANAQVTGTLAAFVGYYQPFGHFDPASVYDTSLPETPEDLRGSAWGGVGHLAFGNRFGVAVQVATTNSRVPESINPGGVSPQTDAPVFLATVQGQYAIPLAPHARLWLNAGTGFVRHGGTAYARRGTPASLAGAFGTTLEVPVAWHLQLTANATALVYPFDVPMPPNLRLNPGSLQHGIQEDALLHVGVAWRPR